MKRRYLKFEDLKPDKDYYNIQRNKYNGSYRKVECSPSIIEFVDGSKHKFVYGIWTNNNEYEDIGYIPKNKKKKSYRKY